VRKADNLPLSCAVVTKSGRLNFLEPSGPVQACNGTALPFTKAYNSQCLTNQALLVKSVIQTISKNKQNFMHKFLTVLLNNNKLSNYQVTATQENLSYDITAVKERTTDMLFFDM